MLAYEWSSQRLDPAADTLSTDLENLYDAKVAEGDALAREATATFHGARRLVLALLALIFLVAIPACVFTIRGIRLSVEAIVARLASLRSHDVAGLRDGLGHLAAGDLTFELTPVTPPIHRRTRDEIGDVAEAVGEIRDDTAASMEAYNASRAALADDDRPGVADRDRRVVGLARARQRLRGDRPRRGRDRPRRRGGRRRRRAPGARA